MTVPGQSQPTRSNPPASLADVLSASSTGIVTLDRHGRTLWSNAAAHWLTGTPGPADHAVETPVLSDIWTLIPLDLRHPKGPGDISYWSGEMERRGGDGITRTLAIEVAVHRDHLGVVDEVSVLLRDISEAQRLHRELIHQASHDMLTGMPNRSRFRRSAAEAVERLRHDGGTLAVLFVDLDHLKDINDVAGHDVGDRVIVHAGERLMTSVRPTDLVARWGGDEFVVLCDGVTDTHAALEIAERIRRSLSERTEIDGRPVATGSSIGVAVLEATEARHDPRPPFELADELLQQADAAMYLAKQRGRGRSELFDAELGRHLELRRRRGEELAEALASSTMTIVWHPVQDLSTDAVTGWMLGALWQTPDGSLLGYREIVDIALRAGLGRTLGHWLMGHATGALPATGRAVVMIPWNSAQLADPDAVETARAIASRLPGDARRLMVTVDESALSRSDVASERSLRALARYGIATGVTGVGASSTPLRRLVDLPLERLVIDSSVVAELGIDRCDEAVTRSLIHLGHALDIVVGADLGTGSSATLARRTERLRALGCDEILGRPRTQTALEGAPAKRTP